VDACVDADGSIDDWPTLCMFRPEVRNVMSMPENRAYVDADMSELPRADQDGVVGPTTPKPVFPDELPAGVDSAAPGGQGEDRHVGVVGGQGAARIADLRDPSARPGRPIFVETSLRVGERVASG